MTIAIFNWRDIRNPKGGGAEIVTHQYAKGWVKAGHKVTLVCPAFPKSLPQETLDGVKIVRLGLNRPLNFLLIHPLIFYYYFRYLRGNVDIIVDQIHWVPVFSPLFVKEKKLAFIHEVSSSIWETQKFSRFLGILGKALNPFFFWFYRKIPFLTVSKVTKKELTKYGFPSKNITVTPNGTNLNPLKTLPSRGKPPVFMYLGRISWVKNLEDIVAAFQIIKKYIPESRLKIVGEVTEPSYGKELNKLILKAGLKESVDQLGYVSEAKKRQLLKTSYLLLHASRTEGWGLVVIEAAAMGTPAVVYNVPGLSESVVNGKTGVVCSQNTPEEMAKQVLRLLSDNKKYRKMQKNCLVWVKEFSWKKSIKKSLKLIESI